MVTSAESARTAIGILGNIICYFFFLSPVSVEQYSPFPYLAAMFSCLIWTLYSLPWVHPRSTLVLSISFSGVVIESVYILIFLIFSDKPMRLRVGLVLLVELSFVALIGSLVLTERIRVMHEKRSLIVGVVCIFASTVMYSSPLAVMKVVMTTKSVEFMPFLLSLASFLNNLAWIIYALLRFDLFLIIPNGLGVLFGTAQFILYGVYYQSTKQIMEARKKAKGINCSNEEVKSNYNVNVVYI